MPSPDSGAPTATPSPSPGRLWAAGFVGADARGPLGSRGSGFRGAGRKLAVPGGGAYKPETWKAWQGNCQPASAARGSGRRKFVGAPGGDGLSGYGYLGCHPGADEAQPGAAGVGAPGGWAAAVESCPPPKGQRGAQAAVPRPRVQHRGNGAGVFPTSRSEGCGSRICPRRRQLSGSGNSVPPAPAILVLFYPVPPRCPGRGRRWVAAQAGLKFNF